MSVTQENLYVDLTTGKTRTEKLNEEIAKKYIGGIGLGMRLWLANSKAGVDPLSPENPLVLALGPVSGTMFPTGGNGHAFISKSPETNGVGEAVSHGTFGAELKRAGYDAVILTGKAENQFTYGLMMIRFSCLMLQIFGVSRPVKLKNP